MFMHEQSLSRRIRPQTIFILALFIVGLYVVLPQISSFHSSIKYLTSPKIGYLLVALTFIYLTFFEAGLSYLLLAFRKLNLARMFFIQNAVMFVNNLLPAGIGGLGANFAYLRGKKHTAPQAASMVYANNTIGLIGHMLILFVVLSLSPKKDFVPSTESKLVHGILIVLGVTLLIILLAAVIFGRKKVRKFLGDALTQLASYRDRKLKLFFVLLVQMSLTLSNVACLFFAERSVGVHLSFSSTLIIFTLGSSIKNATPTPGGLGGYEAGLLAGFAAYKVDASQSLAAVLIYRLVSYWIPLLTGLVSFIYNERKGQFEVATSGSG